MNVSRRYPARLVLTLAAAALVLVIGAAAAFGQGSGPSGHASGGGVSGSSGSMGVAGPGTLTVGRPDVAVSSGIAAPAWCCGSTGSVPGLTTYGQANMDGQGQTARDAAIAAAVKDATAQATVAADAAGITLGPIIDMQVSAMPSYYPMPMAGTTSGSGTTPGSSSGSSGTGGMEPAPIQYFGSVSVTMTWSLA
jgi:hypothetical protein